MKKFSLIYKIIIILALVCTAMFSLFFISCNNAPSGPEGLTIPQDYWEKYNQKGKTQSVAITLDNYNVSITQYKTLTIRANVIGTNDAVVWTSSDETVATVTGGDVLALSEGTCEITATVAGKSAVCEVEVTPTSAVPRIVLSNEVINILKGDKFTTDVSIEWAGDTSSIIYKAQVEEGASFVSVAIDNIGRLTITGKEKGKAIISVIAEVGDKTVSRPMEINVTNELVSFVTNNEEIVIGQDGGYYAASVDTETIEGFSNNVLDASFDVYENGVKQASPKITWSTTDTEAIKISGNKITAEKSGQYDIEGDYQTSTGGTTKLLIKLSVSAIELTIDQSKVIDIDSLKDISTVGLTYTIAGQKFNFDAGKNPEQIVVSIADKQIAGFKNNNLTFKSSSSSYKDNYPTKAKELGEQFVVIKTATRNYYLPVSIYTKIIYTKADLETFKTLAAKNGTKYPGDKGGTYQVSYDGYFILGADIEYNGEFKSLTDTSEAYLTNYYCKKYVSTWQDMTMFGFKGVFDGMGHTISGMKILPKANISSNAPEMGGFIGYMNVAGVIRNISFIHATVLENNGYICSIGGGTIENVYVSYDKIGCGYTDRVFEKGNADNRFMGTFYTFASDDKAKVINCIIDATNAEVKKIVGARAKDGKMDCNIHLASSKASILQSCVVITADKDLQDYSYATSLFNYYSEIAEYGSLEQKVWKNDFWKFKGHAIYCDGMLKDELKITNISDGETIPAGTEKYVKISNTAIKLDLMDVPEEYEDFITIDGLTLKIDAVVPKGVEFKLKAVSYINNDIDIISLVTGYSVEEVALTKSVDINLDIDENGKVTSNNFTLDLTELKDILGENVDTIMFNGEVLSAKKFEIKNNKVEIPTNILSNSIFGNQKISFYTSNDVAKKNYCINVNAVVYSKVVTTSEQFLSLSKIINKIPNNAGYIVLGNNITLTTGQEIYSTTNNYTIEQFSGIFDGNGYTINGLSMFARQNNIRKGWIINAFGCTIKNVSFTNAIVKYENSLIAYKGTGTFENIYVRIKEQSMYGYGWTGQGDAIFFGGEPCSATTVLKNIVVDWTNAFIIPPLYDNHYTRLLGAFNKNTDITNVVCYGTPEIDVEYKGETVKDMKFVLQDGSNYLGYDDGTMYMRLDGSSLGVYAKNNNGGTNGVTFPAEDWDTTYWTVNAETETVTWKTKN